ncbi:hypothetical protein [Peribacillus saganii]|nr:hypothetical protein [Peribacillus saganii]
MKKLILLFASVIILISIDHQSKGGYKDPRTARLSNIETKESII